MAVRTVQHEGLAITMTRHLSNLLLSHGNDVAHWKFGSVCLFGLFIGCSFLLRPGLTTPHFWTGRFQRYHRANFNARAFEFQTVDWKMVSIYILSRFPAHDCSLNLPLSTPKNAGVWQRDSMPYEEDMKAHSREFSTWTRWMFLLKAQVKKGSACCTGTCTSMRVIGEIAVLCDDATTLDKHFGTQFHNSFTWRALALLPLNLGDGLKLMWSLGMIPISIIPVTTRNRRYNPFSPAAAASSSWASSGSSSSKKRRKCAKR